MPIVVQTAAQNIDYDNLYRLHTSPRITARDTFAYVHQNHHVVEKIQLFHLRPGLSVNTITLGMQRPAERQRSNCGRQEINTIGFVYILSQDAMAHTTSLCEQCRVFLKPLKKKP
mmetsp:Transcript_30230/g.73582  ORF Transcript_30230/g.73582 Transcript_30230/m.73582 type:complete len:115 (+) Transcript_30230:79-423(+)